MRDYSFGNLISALRIRSGLSQYQLGALVGVSDKAVSKWENGASKPRMNTILKLAEVFNISVSELLTCKYITLNHERKDLFVMDKRIMSKAKWKMKELYGEKPPISIINRFKMEELMLSNQMMLRWIGFLGELHERFYIEDAFFRVKDVKLCASFVAWLLGGININPLPAHYYCPNCKKVEFIPNVKCGFDAPDKVCLCGTPYNKDGFGIEAINMYPLSGGCEMDVSVGTMGLVKRCFKDYFAEYSDIREIKFKEEKNKVREYSIIKNYTDRKCYILVPSDIAIQYPEEVITVTSEEDFFKFLQMDSLMIVEKTEEHISFKEIENVDFSVENIQAYAKYAVENGKLKDLLWERNLSSVILEFSNLYFSNLLAIEGFLWGSEVWEKNGENLYAKGIPVEELITNREDTYTYLYNKLNEKCCDNPSGQVYEIMEKVRKGLYSSLGMPADVEQLLLENDVPDWYIESMKKIRYLGSKTQYIVNLKKNICSYINMKKAKEP